MKSIKSPNPSAFAAQNATHVLHERYMSSEEQLSPTDNDSTSTSSTGDVDVDDFADDEAEPDHWLEELFSDFTCKMATAICLIRAGKPRLVDVPVPSLTSSHTSSPSMSSEDGEKMPEHIFIPPRPKTPVRRRPVAATAVLPPLLQSSLLRSKLSAATSASSPNVVVATYQPTTYQPTASSAPEHHRVTGPRAVETYVPTAPKFLSVDPFAGSLPLAPLTPPPRNSSHASHHHSRFRNLSQKLRLPFNASKPDLSETVTAVIAEPEQRKRKDSAASLVDADRSFARARSGSVVSLAPAPLFAAAAAVRPSSARALKKKMVPRGAAERAPAIEIPPCPEDLDLNFDAPAYHPNKLRRRKSSILRF
jgi:hypothetical protein